MAMRVKYELIVSLYKNDRVVLMEHDTDYRPIVGDIVNVDGNPFLVYSVGSAFVEGDRTPPLYVYVKVFKAGSFELKIGGKNY